MQRLTHAAIAAATMAALLLGNGATAQTLSGEAGTRRHPRPPGGLIDTVGRIVLAKMAENLGQQFVIDNRPGASGSIGADLVAKAAADGYVLMVHSATHVANPHMIAKLPSTR